MSTVRMVTTAAGPGGTYLAGSIAVVEDAVAAAWIAGGYALPLKTAAGPPARVIADPGANIPGVVEERAEAADPGKQVGGFEGEPETAPAAVSETGEDPSSAEEVKPSTPRRRGGRGGGTTPG